MFAEPGRFPQSARSAPRVQRTENHFRFCTLLEKGSCRNVPVGADQRNQITTLCLAPTRHAHSAFREEKKNVSRPICFFRGSPHISRRTFKMTRSRCCDVFGLSKKTIFSLLRKHRRVKHVSGANAESFQSVTPWTGNASTSVASQVSSSRAVGCVSGTSEVRNPCLSFFSLFSAATL